MAVTSCCDAGNGSGVGNGGTGTYPWDREPVGGMRLPAFPEPMRSAAASSFTLLADAVFSTRLFRVADITGLRRTLVRGGQAPARTVVKTFPSG
jgi:hypothetical protein